MFLIFLSMSPEKLNFRITENESVMYFKAKERAKVDKFKRAPKRKMPLILAAC